MKLKKFVLLILWFWGSLASFAQTQQKPNDLYKDANAYFYFEDYEEALALYLEIYDQFPNNHNLDYRIGLCYLNIYGQKEKAVHYLERAIENTSYKYSENSIKETKAPVDAHFYLGNAYLVNYEFRKAQNAYNNFENIIKNDQKYNTGYLNNQYGAIDRAKTYMDYPINFISTNLGSVINGQLPNSTPAISADGSTLAFTRQEKFYQSINISKNIDGQWSRPINITLDLVVDGNCNTLSLNHDGTELYLFKDDSHDGNIYVTNFVNDRWTPMQKLNHHINTESYETHASLSPDGKTLYFSSNRPGGFGDLDIYMSHRDEETGDWGPPINLGENINSPFNENAPFLSADGKTLFFTSDGHTNMGGYDIFFSRLQDDGSWSKPVNMGYPINTTDDEIFYQPIGNGESGLMTIYDPNGFSISDIVQLEVFLPRYNKEVVSFNDFLDKPLSLAPNTLIIDTVNKPGEALLYPLNKNEIDSYLTDQSQRTIYFEGKQYSVYTPYEDEPEILALYDKLIFSKLEEEQRAIEEARRREAEEELAKAQRLTAEQELAELNKLRLKYQEDSLRLALEHKADLAQESLMAQRELEMQMRLDSLRIIEAQANQKKLQKELEGFDEDLNEVLKYLAAGTVSPNLEQQFNQAWNVEEELLKIKLQNLAEAAKAEGQEVEMSRVFTRLLDAVNAKISENSQEDGKPLTQEQHREQFLQQLESIMEQASPELKQLLGDATEKRPDIHSFTQLLDYLAHERTSEFEPVAEEFLTLLGQAGITAYLALPPELRDIEQQLLDQEEKSELFKILESLAKGTVSDNLIQQMNQEWDVSPDQLDSKVNDLASAAKSYNQEAQLSRVFTRLMDGVSAKKLESKKRGDKPVTQEQLKKEFLTNLKKISKQAGPELNQLLGDAMEKRGDIQSFTRLLDYITKESAQEFEPVAGEFLTLMAKESITGFYALPPHYRNLDAFSDQLELYDKLNEELIDLLISLAEGTLSPQLVQQLDQPWNVEEDLLKEKLHTLGNSAKDYNEETKLSGVFARLLDAVNTKRLESTQEDGKPITQKQLKEEFLSQLQKIREKAGPELNQLLGDAIEKRPDIQSFAQLVDYLTRERTDEFEPVAEEFFALLAQEGITGFFALPEEFRDLDELIEQQKQRDAMERELFEILSSLAQGTVSPQLIQKMDQQWNVNSDLLKVKLNSLANAAKDSHEEAQLSRVFTRLLDAVNAKRIETSKRQPRSVIKSKTDEEFFYRLQNVRRKAGPELTQLLDETILSQPQISSFTDLLDYLLKEKFEEFESLQCEFLQLVSEEALKGYFSLSAQQRKEIHSALTHKQKSIKGAVIASGILLLIVLLLLFLLKKKKEDQQ